MPKTGRYPQNALHYKTVSFPRGRVHLLQLKNANLKTNIIHNLIQSISSHHTIPYQGGAIIGGYSKQACIPKNAIPQKSPIPKNPLYPKKPKSQNRPKTGTP
jgi:hypothetical protein